MSMEKNETSSVNIEEMSLGYGGWIRFFRIINALYWIIGLLGLLALLPFIFFALEGGDLAVSILPADLIAILIEVLPGIIMSFIIWRVVLVQSENTPNKINKLMQIELFFHIVISACLIYAHKQGYISEGPTPIMVSIIYYFIWATYFKRSKRVLSYYGSNTFKAS